ncbi:MAG TPA: glycosyltransferase family 2 protein [Ignavibacteria bacterium]|nr:glycosyltransferase family 2 protein [Ignavibacteria bacterium]
MNISVIIPVYNEEKTLEQIISKVLDTGLVYEIICVNDGSTDNSQKILEKIQASEKSHIKLLNHKHNSGKGASIITGLKEVSGDLVLIQDADLEYDPNQYKKLFELFKNPEVQVVYGSRNLIQNPKSTYAFYIGGVILSKITNVLYSSEITDESTCYKVFKADLLKNLNLKEKGFEFCPEVTSKILKRKIKIYEIPITYFPRSTKEGKKIKWRDGIKAIWTLFKYKFSE